MFALLQALLALAINAVPVGGVALRGWSPSTALILYWCENLVGSILMALRIAAHRRLTGKSGHARAQLNTTVVNGRRTTRTVASSFLVEFAVTSLLFTFVHGIFLVAVMAIIVKAPPDRAEVLQGLPWMIAFQLASFAIDRAALRDWSFAELKTRAMRLMGRVVLVHFAILGGMFVAAFRSRPTAFFSVFGALKTLSDLAGLFPSRPKAPGEAPRWFVSLMRRLGLDKHHQTGQDVAAWWRESSRVENRQEAEDEQVLPPPA